MLFISELHIFSFYMETNKEARNKFTRDPE